MSYLKKTLSFLGAAIGVFSGCSRTQPPPANDPGNAGLDREPIASRPVTLTEQAAQQILRVSSDNDLMPGWKMRIAVQADPNTEGAFLYQMAFADSSETVGDLTYTNRGVPLAVSRESLPLIDGTQIDFEVSPTQTGFRFHNPNAIEH